MPGQPVYPPPAHQMYMSAYGSHYPGAMHPYHPPPIQPPVSVAPSTATVDTTSRSQSVIKLEISAKGLRDRDVTSKSDPICVVFMEDNSPGAYHHYAHQMTAASAMQQQQAGGGANANGASSQFGFPEPGGAASGSNSQSDAMIKWSEIGRTECIKNCLDPHFKMQVTVSYHFEQLQHLRLGLWDIDTKKPEKLANQDFLGEVHTTLGELVRAGVWDGKLTSPNRQDMVTMLGNKRDLGKITVVVHENRDGGHMLIKCDVEARKLDRKDMGLTSDPYFIVTQLGGTKSSTALEARSQLYESEVVKRNVNPKWRAFQLKAVIPKGGTKSDIKLEFQINDRDTHKRDDEIGTVERTVDQLETATSLPVINKKKLKRWRYTNSGTLEVKKFKAIQMPSLLNYLQAGLKLHFTVAVDLTASNGNPMEQGSLHFMHNMYGNHYTRALMAVASVLKSYCSNDNLFSAYGFGAELPTNPGTLSSCFPLSLGQDPTCFGVEGVLQAYGTAVSQVRLSGPTNFAPLIDTVMRTASQRANSQTEQNYDVLLILTDGVVSDFDLTVDRIIAASGTVPLSIIIIGIGTRDFSKMNDLDSDNQLLTSSDGKRTAARDICQFVQFERFMTAPEKLGSAVLAELPMSIVEYYVGVCEPAIMPTRRQG